MWFKKNKEKCVKSYIEGRIDGIRMSISLLSAFSHDFSLPIQLKEPLLQALKQTESMTCPCSLCSK